MPAVVHQFERGSRHGLSDSLREKGPALVDGRPDQSLRQVVEQRNRRSGLVEHRDPARGDLSRSETLHDAPSGLPPDLLRGTERLDGGGDLIDRITVLLGIAGRERSRIHTQETGRVLSAIDPEYVGALSLMLIPETPLYKDYVEGKFPLISADEMLEELRSMIAHTDLTRGLFHANHASNYLPIKARLPRDKDSTIRLIDAALAGQVPLRPEWMRGL